LIRLGYGFDYTIAIFQKVLQVGFQHQLIKSASEEREGRLKQRSIGARMLV